MHIVYVSREYPPSLRGGGIASYLKEISVGMRQAGHQVTIVCASDDTRKSADTVDENGIRVIRLSGGDFLIPQIEGNSIIKKLRPLYRFWSYRKKILECIKSLRNVDIIEVAEYGAESLFLNRLNIPIVLRLHTPMLLDHLNFSKLRFSPKRLLYYYQGNKELQLMREASFCTSCSTSLAIWGVKYAGMRQRLAQVIYNPVDTNLFVDDDKSQTEREVPFQILYAGTICDWKGCGDLAVAGCLLTDELRHPFTISFVGKTGAYAEILRKKYASTSWFNLVGKIPREELQRRFKDADVVVFPSWWENMPMVCIEAMLQGAVVLGSRAGGMSEIIEDGKSGFLVEPSCPELLAKRIKEILLMTDQQHKEISSAAKKRIRSEFSTEVIVRRTVEYYRFAIQEYTNHH